jgi:hypothetical protein
MTAKTKRTTKPKVSKVSGLAQVIEQWAKSQGIKMPKRKPSSPATAKAAMLAALTAFNRIMDGYPPLAMDVHSPQELEADRKASHALMRRSIDRTMETAEDEIAQFQYRDDFGDLLRLFAEQKARDDATDDWDEVGDQGEREHAYFRARVEAQKYLHVCELIAARVPNTVEHLGASLDILAERLRDIDEGDMWAAWVRNIASGVRGLS